jgi:hypothetical protein
MKSFVLIATAAVFVAASTGAFAQATAPAAPAAKGDGPCAQIEKACASAGFVKSQAKQGNGLFVDCVKPIVSGQPQPKNAVRPLPSIDQGVVQACRAKPHPKKTK